MAEIVPATAENLQHAAELLRAGELVCFPTETVYGLGADASDAAAVRRIFEAKGRPAHHPLIVHLHDVGQLPAWAEDVPEAARVLAQRFWPGPLTIVMKRHERVPLEVTGGQDTVAIRVPGHPVARRLLELFGGALAAPSANRFGRISPTTARHAAGEMGGRVALIVDGGPAEVGVESTIVDLSSANPRLLRPGILGRGQLEEALGVEIGSDTASPAPRVPGALERHYSPDSPVEIVDPERLYARLVNAKVAVLSRRPVPEGFSGPWVQLPSQARAYARALYAALRELDDLGLPILVEAPPSGEAWEAIRDRLRRASSGTPVVTAEGAK